MNNNLKRMYLKYMNELYFNDEALDNNINEFLMVEKNKDFVFLEYKDDEILRNILDNLEPDELPDINKLEEEYQFYNEHLCRKLEERAILYNDRNEIERRFEKYLFDNNLSYTDIDDEWHDYVTTYESKWYGWSSNDLICQGMYSSILETDEEEINKIIENGLKVLELCNDDYEPIIYNYIRDLEFINKYLRFNEEYNGCEHVFILDCLENDRQWDIYKEPFIRFVDRIISDIDREYLLYLKYNNLKNVGNGLE